MSVLLLYRFGLFLQHFHARFFMVVNPLTYYDASIFTALHVMQTRYSDENSVRPSVRPSHAWIVTKRKKDLFRFLHNTKDNLA